MIIPDLIEPVIGWRAWSIIPANPREPRLRPFAGELVDWLPGVASVASCYLNHDAAPPVLTCTCGLYAHKTVGELWAEHMPMRGTTEPVVTWGSVSLWGRVLSYASGYRAEFGYPQHLWVESPEAAEILRARYLIPVSPLLELMASKPDVIDIPAERRGTHIKPWVDKTGGRANEFIRLTNPVTSSTLEYAWPIPDIVRLIAGVPRGHWQRAICVGVFQTGGCEPNRWMNPRGACTDARLLSLRDVLSKLAGRGVKIKRIPGRWGGELGANYRVTAIGSDPVAAPRPHTRRYPVNPMTVQP